MSMVCFKTVSFTKKVGPENGNVVVRPYCLNTLFNTAPCDVIKFLSILDNIKWGFFVCKRCNFYQIMVCDADIYTIIKSNVFISLG